MPPCNMRWVDRIPVTLGEQITARIDRRGECWWWNGNYAALGYPIIKRRSGNIHIIPLLWKQQYGPTPEGMVLHCIHPMSGSGMCVNPAHYRPGLIGRNPRELNT